MKATYYFGKTDKDADGYPIEYRIYLCESLGWPLLVRSALDAAEGVHAELVEQLNGATDYLKGKLHEPELLSGLSISQLGEILSSTARRAIVTAMENDGWTIHFPE